MRALQAGDIVGDKYRIVRKIAAGGMATIYEGVATASATKVALKIPHDSFRQDRDAIKRFLREARSAMAIDSPHVVRTLAVGRLRNQMPFIAMEYIDGIPLRDLMYDPQGRAQPVELETTMSLVDQIAAAMQAAHAVHVIHRDIKPDNVLVSFGKEGMIAKVFDFGLSLHSSEVSISRLTAPGITFGTPQYMPPEQSRNAGEADERADIYALGVITYEMLAARFPFEGQTALEVWRNAANGQPTPLSTPRPDLPAALVQLVMRALSRDPELRPQTARAFRDELAPFLSQRSRTSSVEQLPSSSPGSALVRLPIQVVMAQQRSPTLPRVVAAVVFVVLVSAVVIAVLALAGR